MKPNVMLIIASLLSIILMIFHMTDDIVRGMEPGTLFDLIIVPVLAVWLYGALVLRERRSGYVIVLVASLLGLLVPIIHMKGAGVGGAIAKSSSPSCSAGTNSSATPLTTVSRTEYRLCDSFALAAGITRPRKPVPRATPTVM